MYCSNCGKEVSNDATYCPNCGYKLIQTPNSNNQDYYRQDYNQENNQEGIDGFFEDRGDYWKAEYNQPQQENQSLGIGWLLLSALAPLAGLIVAIVFWRKRPRTAKWALGIAIAGYIINWIALKYIGIDNLIPDIIIQLMR